MMKSLCYKKSIRIMLAGFVLLLLALSSVGIYFATKKPTPIKIENPLEFSTDKWDGKTSSKEEWDAGFNYGKRKGENNENTYTINSADAFIHFVNLVNSGETFEGVIVYLNKNIDLNNNTINSLKNFKGTFNGAYYTIFNANIKGNGLFNQTENATIQNLGMYNCKIQSKGVAGGLIGTAINTNIHNCYFRLGEVKSSHTAAGLVGSYIAGKNELLNSFAHTTLKGNKTYGLTNVTSGELKIENCYDSKTAKTTNFKTWEGYASKYSLANTWCDYSYAEGSQKLDFEYPILTRFNKVFLTGSCYENVLIDEDGVSHDVETIRSAFELVGRDGEGEVNIIVEKVFMEETAIATGTSSITLTSSTNTVLERGKTNTDALVAGVDKSSLVIGEKDIDEDTPTIVFDGKKDYAKKQNLKTDAVIVSTGYDFIANANVMVRNNINNKTGYGGGISLMFPYVASYTSTDEISAVGLIGGEVANCSATKDGGGIYVSGTFAQFENGLSFNVHGCSALNGGGMGLLLGENVTQSKVNAYYSLGNYKDEIRTDRYVDDSYVQSSDNWILEGEYYQCKATGTSEDSSGCGGAIYVTAYNGGKIKLGDTDTNNTFCELKVHSFYNSEEQFPYSTCKDYMNCNHKQCKNTRSGQNSAEFGGGIYIRGYNYSLTVIASNIRINCNYARNMGGGMYLQTIRYRLSQDTCFPENQSCFRGHPLSKY